MNKQPVNTVKPQELEAPAGTLEKVQSVVYKIVMCSDKELKEIDKEFQRLLAKSNSSFQNQYP